MARLEAIKHTTPEGIDYWMARDLGPVLGYKVWGAFEPVIKRAGVALKKSGVEPSEHISLRKKLWKTSANQAREGRDYFLTRGACYLIAMNGESYKPEISAAQLYFTIQTRRMEEQDAHAGKPIEDAKRLKLRGKVTASLKRVSSIAAQAGVKRQAVFHGERIKGFYGMGQAQVYEKKCLPIDEELLDNIGELELSAHEFQMKLAATAIENENIQGEPAALRKNFEVAQEVRKAWRNSIATPPEDLPKAEHISKVRRRLSGNRQPKTVTQSDPIAFEQLSLLSLPSVPGSGS